MAGVTKKSFDRADEVRTPDKTRVEMVEIQDVQAARFTMQPGWTWSECVRPVAGTGSCQARHVGVVGAGHLHIKHDDGTEADLGPGDAYMIAPGHDAWVTGDEPFIGYEFESKTARTYAEGS